MCGKGTTIREDKQNINEHLLERWIHFQASVRDVVTVASEENQLLSIHRNG